MPAFACPLPFPVGTEFSYRNSDGREDTIRVVRMDPEPSEDRRVDAMMAATSAQMAWVGSTRGEKALAFLWRKVGVPQSRSVLPMAQLRAKMASTCRDVARKSQSVVAEFRSADPGSHPALRAAGAAAAAEMEKGRNA